MAAKQPRLNVLQPKRFNTNHTVLVTNCNNDSLGNHCILGVSKQNNQESSPVFEIASSALSTTPVFPLSLGVTTSSASSTPSATSLQRNRPPNTMAKRNARERNRVKQVNQGFQTLRQHIPDNYRLKKMSKVDTLRCALNYIRSLEKVLDITFEPGMLKMENTEFELEDDFSQSSISPTQMDSFCGGGGSGESCSDQSYVYGVNESATTSDHSHSSGQQGYIGSILGETHEDLMSHQDTENVHHIHEMQIISDDNFKNEVEEHFLSVEID